MSLSVKLKQFQIPNCRGPKVAKIQFRGVSYTSKIFDDTGNECVVVDQRFEWPIARPVEDDEFISIEIYLRNKLIVIADKLLGIYKMGLQKVALEGRINVYDNMVDINNRALGATIEFCVLYSLPDDSMSSFTGNSGIDHVEDEELMLINIGRNIANIEKSLLSDNQAIRYSPDVSESKIRGTRFDSPSEKTVSDRKRTTFTKMRSLIKFGKSRQSKDSDTDDETALLPPSDNLRKISDKPCEFVPMSRTESCSSIDSDKHNLGLDDRRLLRFRELKNRQAPTEQGLKAQDFQVCITIIEVRQLAGINMDPVVCIQIGDEKKFTSVKESTNCPYYNEYFVFDFHMPPIMLFDKIINLSVLQSRNFLRGHKLLGSFKLDVATVWSQPDHQFYHKWALITDPDDMVGGTKGYLKCDICVIGKGDTMKVPSKSDKDEDDIEANLLLPDGVPTDRQMARYIIKIYRADGLPKMNSTLMANVRKALMGEVNDLVDPYVQVSFAGLTGKTSVMKHNYTPVWNEQLVFTEMFPPLCQRIKIQLKGDDPIKPRVIGTYFIDLAAISNDGEKGFTPTFGPSFVHMYGSTRDYCILDEHSSLNTGLGEGVSYRARLLMSIKTEITENIDLLPSGVCLEPTLPLNEAAFTRNEEFFLFATILDASMIDKKLGDKPVYFEISMANAGNAIDGQNMSAKEYYDGDSDELETVTSDSSFWQSTTSPTKPMTHDKIYYFLPYWDNKPCLHIRSSWPDYRRRMYNSNIIGKIADKLEDALEEIISASDREDRDTEYKLKVILEELSIACGKYVTVSKASMSGPGSGKTKLDKERLKLCQREIEHIGNAAKNLRAIVTKNSFKDRLKTAQTYLSKLKFLTEDPQHALPDVFLWMICGGKRQAYHRVSARDIIYSIVEEEKGRNCGTIETIFLKWPGKRNTGPSGWSVPAKLQIYFWLGLLKHKKNFVSGIPKGYEISQEIKNADRARALPPSTLHYVEKHIFQLRAYIYQARSLIGSDASGLSDPFARIIAGEFCKTTQVIEETLSPTWDELLIFEEILIFGTANEIKEDPPSIVVEIFDQDKVGKSEFIGRALAKPHVKLNEQKHQKSLFSPPLEWFTIRRGIDHAGELLAAFELLEIPGVSDDPLPGLPNPKNIPIFKDTDPKNIEILLPIPKDIRPTLARYRIDVLFWGLRDLKRIHLLNVDKPRVDIECAGNILHSSIITNFRKNLNFSTPVKFLELDLPEQELYRPPLTIRVVDCRSFGRYTLVGSHTINSIHKYIIASSPRRREANEEEKPFFHPLNSYGETVREIDYLQLPIRGSEICEKENSPLLLKGIPFPVGYGTQDLKKKSKTRRSKKRKFSVDEFDDEDDDTDWWAKYFASVDRMITESTGSKYANTQNGTLPFDDDANHRQPGHLLEKNTGFENKLRFGFKQAATAAHVSAKLSPKCERKRTKRKLVLFKIYPTELEAIPEFHQFKDWLKTFELYRGKKTGNESEDDTRVVGHFKGALKVYKLPLSKDNAVNDIMEFDPHYGLLHGIPSNEPIRVLVRIYVVKAIDLHPMDLNGKADPYVVLQLGSKRISDKDNYISKQLNPVFGRCFEMNATFPQDSVLCIQINDWDLVGTDDIIGETKIDLENRFFSKHRATCGLPEEYNELSCNAWRDPMKPTQILAKLCKEAKLEAPVYGDYQVKVGKQVFTSLTDNCVSSTNKLCEENMALAVLHRWHEVSKTRGPLVPEHIETRSLYNPDKPGIEQGKLEMWIDMFPMDMPLPGPPIDISPRKPKGYELRVIIWNTEDVVLEDDAFFTGEKMSDIYIKGWLKGPEDCQSTDIHYRSLTGEGNFNWRFIFPFDYLVAEQKIVISRKESIFSWDETECKIPARLELQVWDADHFSADDFLGAITLDLNRFPRGAKSSKLCSLSMLSSDESVPTANIFKQKRVKGWWPFYVKKDNEEMELTGKVEAEIHLLSKEEAEKAPSGLGRGEPDPLEKPRRPDSSFMWFMNPIKSIRYILWNNYKWTILKSFIFLVVVTIILLFFYSIPGYTVKKMLGA
ncbi:otoferlin-like isoform X2 [Euwallacea fornicatus]|uniref:otoferlin-like isoform X2 n=1 Tax=Euwallacea fornicatus TaxID=995702 RepID=UPI00338E8A1D